jgi:hypothetical protein
MSAANFVILGAIINRLGYQYSRLSAKYCENSLIFSRFLRLTESCYWYVDAIVFIVVDVAALIVQSIGGAKAEQAAQNNGDPDVGGRIMLGGILVQLGMLLQIHRLVTLAEIWMTSGNHDLHRCSIRVLLSIPYSSPICSSDQDRLAEYLECPVIANTCSERTIQASRQKDAIDDCGFGNQYVILDDTVLIHSLISFLIEADLL